MFTKLNFIKYSAQQGLDKQFIKSSGEIAVETQGSVQLLSNEDGTFVEGKLAKFFGGASS